MIIATNPFPNNSHRCLSSLRATADATVQPASQALDNTTLQDAVPAETVLVEPLHCSECRREYQFITGRLVTCLVWAPESKIIRGVVTPDNPQSFSRFESYHQRDSDGQWTGDDAPE